MNLLPLLFAALISFSLSPEPGPTLRVDYSNPGLIPASWTLEIHSDGTGHFHSQRGTRPPDKDHWGIDPPDVDRDLHFSADFTQHVFQVSRRHHLFQTACESHMKVAFQGTKTLTYSGPDGQGSCEFNYSRDNEIQAFGDTMIGVAMTLIEGAKLESLLQHDKLGLDKEIEDMQTAVSEGRLQQVGLIGDTLQKLADDPSVMDRVRKRARMMLAKAGS